MTVLTLSNVRLSFPRLDIPDYFQGVKQRPNDVKQWSAAFHVDVTDPQKKLIDDALVEVAKAKWGAKWAPIHKALLPDPKGCCWVDGEAKGHPGVMILSAKRRENEGPPLVYDNDKSPIYGPDRMVLPGKEGRLFAGCYVKAQVEIWAQDNKAGKGLRCGLLIVQRMRKGEAFGGGSAPNPNDFEEIEDGADAEDLS